MMNKQHMKSSTMKATKAKPTKICQLYSLTNKYRTVITFPNHKYNKNFKYVFFINSPSLIQPAIASKL